MSIKKHHHSKMTLHQEAVIFHQYLNEGGTLRKYAEANGTSVHTIGRIITEGFDKLKKNKKKVDKKVV